MPYFTFSPCKFYTGWWISPWLWSSLKGIMMFVVITLIGTGWSFVKPVLSDRDKKIFLVVIPLQVQVCRSPFVLSPNVFRFCSTLPWLWWMSRRWARHSAPRGTMFWRLQISSAVVLFCSRLCGQFATWRKVPLLTARVRFSQGSFISISRRPLVAARNLQKLKLFRQFYIMVVAWIYFTRIIVYLLDATVNYKYVRCEWFWGL